MNQKRKKFANGICNRIFSDFTNPYSKILESKLNFFPSPKSVKIKLHNWHQQIYKSPSNKKDAAAKFFNLNF